MTIYTLYFFLFRFWSNFPYICNTVNWSIFCVALSIIVQIYVNIEKNIQFLWLKTSISQVFRKIVKLEWLTHCFTLFFKFLKKKTALIRTYPHYWSVFKEKDYSSYIVQQPTNFINKAKRYVKKNFNDLEKEYPAFSELHLKRTRQLWLCWWFLPKIRYHKRHSRTFLKTCYAFVFKNGYLLDRYGWL